MLPPTNIDQCLRLISTMQGYYQNALLSFEEDDKFYEGLLDDLVEVPEGFDVTIPTTGRALVDEAVDNVEPYDIQIRYAPRGFGQQSQKDAEAVSRTLKNVWTYWRQKNSDIDILRDFIKNLFKNGKAVFKCVPDWTLWPSLSPDIEKGLLEEDPTKGMLKDRVRIIQNLRKENFPVICRSLSPRHVWEDPTMDARKLWIVESYEMSNEEIINRFAEYVPELKLFEAFSYIVREIWTATYIDENGKFVQGKHWIFINEQCVNGENGEDNPYHDVPYVIKHSGFGVESYDAKPELKATGFFTRQVKSMLRAEMRRVTHFDALMSQLAFPILVIPDIMEDIGFDTSPGAVNYVPEDFISNAQNMFIQAKLPAPEYMQSINIIQSQIERGTTQRAVRGAGVPGTDSAAQLSMITAQAKLRLEPIKRATEEAVDMINSMVLRYIDEIFDEPVSVFGAEPDGPDQYVLKPSQIRGRYRTRTTFMPSDEQTKERKLVLVTDAMTKASLNPYDALVFAGWENPMEVIARNLAYTIMQEPSIKRQLAKQALKDWGLDAQELEIEEMNEQSMVQQMLAELKARMQGQGQGQPGTELQGQPQGASLQQGMGGGSASFPNSPQAQGAPLQQVQQMPDVNQMRSMTGG